jgi:hypothetical protein
LRLRPFWSFVGAAPSLAAAYVSVINSGASAPQVLSVSPAGSLAMPRELHTAMLLNNRTVRIAGGVTLVTFSLAAELFDPVSGGFYDQRKLAGGSSFNHSPVTPERNGSGSRWLGPVRAWNASYARWAPVSLTRRVS